MILRTLLVSVLLGSLGPAQGSGGEAFRATIINNGVNKLMSNYALLFLSLLMTTPVWAQGPHGEVRPKPAPAVNQVAAARAERASRAHAKATLSDQYELELKRGDAALDGSDQRALNSGDRFAAAAQHYRAAIRLNPKDARGHYGLAVALYESSRGSGRAIPEAISEIREALRLKPDTAEFYMLGKALAEADASKTEVIAAFQNALKLDPTNAAAHYMIGVTYADDLKYDEALVEYKLAAKSDPKAIDPHHAMGDYYSGNKRYDEAAAEYRLAIAGKYCFESGDDCESTGKLYDRLGQMLDLQHKYPEAIGAYNKAIEENPADWDFYNHLGGVYFAQGNYGLAAEQYERVIKLNDRNDEGHYGLGLARLRAGDKAAAVTEYETLKKLNSEYAAKLLAWIDAQ